MMGRVTVVAEIGSNFDQSYDRALRLIEAAAQAGADAVKTQVFRAEWLAHPSHPAYETLRQNELPRYWLPKLAQHARDCGIRLAGTPFDLEAVRLLDELDVPFIKIASGDLTYRPLIRAAAQTGRPLVISTGGATEQEIAAAVRAVTETLRDDGRLEEGETPPVVFLHCTVAYPCEAKDANLGKLRERLSDRRWKGGPDWGFSDHTLSVTLPAVAVGMGAVMVEKHLTLSRGNSGPDHGHSLEPGEFAQMVRAIRETEGAADPHNTWTGPLPVERGVLPLARRGCYEPWDEATRQAADEDGMVWLRPAR